MSNEFCIEICPFNEVERCFNTVAKNGNNVEATGNKVASQLLQQCCWCGPGFRWLGCVTCAFSTTVKVLDMQMVTFTFILSHKQH